MSQVGSVESPTAISIALYPSDLEPWSEYLTSEQGKAPDPLYDPLELWVRESHARGLELHAWFNPYRARHTAAKSPNASSHIANRSPHAVKSYGGYQWMDPAEPDASEQTLKVILDVVRRYDIDGVHIDDYFYPYPVNETSNGLGDANPDAKSKAPAEVPFPDDPAWEVYQSSKLDLGKKLSRALKSANGQAEADFASPFVSSEKGTVVCSAIDRCGNEGERARLEF